jgi:hypothetical protein
MRFKTFRRIRVLAVSLTTVTATTTLFAIAGTAGPAAAAAGNGCPPSKTAGSTATASNVTASFANSGNTTSYTFSSVNENPVGGVPGLIKYCVYPSPSTLPTEHTVSATGANGAPWLYGKGSNNFAFLRPGGNKTNIPLDGNTTTMGTATWGTLPDSQIIILHINDSTECTRLYGSGTPATCFVKPLTAPICNAGDTSAAYNAMPAGVVNCSKPSLGFEATNTNEFGDEVGLAGTARTLGSLKVLFASYACQSGSWNTGNCASATGAEFSYPITANIYAVDNSTSPPSPGTLLATVTTTQTIPYRPSADPVNCPGTGQWFNPLAPGGGACQNQKSTVLTFTNWTYRNGFDGTLPDQVIWTVAFNTSHAGYTPTGVAGPSDSLNVGAMSYPGAPYAGTDTNEDLAFISSGGTTAPLQADSGWTGVRPLGEIIATP